MFVFQLMQFWMCLRTGQLKADVTKKSGTRQSMDQFRYLFNTTRIPQQDEDVLRETKREQKKCSDTTVYHSGFLEPQKKCKN